MHGEHMTIPYLLDPAAPLAAAMHCVATAAVFLAAISNFLMALFFKALAAAALVTALQAYKQNDR